MVFEGKVNRMGIILVTVNKKMASVQIYMFSKVKKTIGFFKFMDK